MKCLFDFSVAVVGGLLLFPLMLAVALAVRLSSVGPVFYMQERVGKGGKLFLCMKFRTMRVDTNAVGSVTALTNDRVTPVGRFLRRWKLDELPQLWNVLKGEMSFVGPRPDVPGYADRLSGDDRVVLSVRPGITGPATLLFRDEEQLLMAAADPKAFNDQVVFPEKLRLNRDYVARLSFWRDIGYILATVLPGLSRRTGLDRRLGLDFEGFRTRMLAKAREGSQETGDRGQPEAEGDRGQRSEVRIQKEEE